MSDSSEPPLVPPLEAMADWEKELWLAHVGTWTSHYVIRDASGAIVDEHDAVNDIALDLERNLYSQRNVYTRGDAVEIRRYSARFDGRGMVIRGRILEGEARAHDDKTIILWFRNTDRPVQTVENIVLLGAVSRSRGMMHFEDGRQVRVTSVWGEKRVSATPDIDADGRDLGGQDLGGDPAAGRA